MTQSIVSAISDYLTPEAVGKLAALSGLDNALAQRAIAAAVPSMLSGLADVVSKPGGARQLANAVADQPTDILSNLAGSLTGSAQTADRGTGLMSSLLGGGAFGVLVSAVAKFLGVRDGSVRTLMGLLTPAIMGVLSQRQGTGNLDVNGLARVLTDQKEQIAAAMPAGLGRLLETSGFHENVGLASSHERPGNAPRGAYEPVQAGNVQRVANDTLPRASSGSWAYWVLPLLALAGLLWYLLPSARDSVEPSRTAAARVTYLTSAPANWTSIGAAPNEYVNRDVYNRTGEKLGTIKDVLVGPDGRMAAAIVNVGRYLGIGEKDVAIPFTALQLEQGDPGRRIVIDAQKESLQTAPNFEKRQPPKQQ
jgi:hypothetical protein